VSYKDIYSFVRHVQGYMTQAGQTNMFTFDFCRVPVCFTNCSWGLRLSTPACHLRQGCSAACVMLLPHGPRCFCCRAIGNIISIVGM